MDQGRGLTYGQAGVDIAELEHIAFGNIGGRRRRFDAAGDHVGKQQWRIRLHRLVDVDDMRQHLVVDLDLVGAFLRLRQGLGQHDGDSVADIVDFAVGDGRMRRHLHRRAVLGMDHPAADDVADAIGQQLLAIQHIDNARHGLGRGRIEIGDPRVRIR